MPYLKSTVHHGARVMGGALLMLLLASSIPAKSDYETPTYSPAVNADGLRGLTGVGSAEPMGEGRITFSVMLPWYQQETAYPNTPNRGSNIFTGPGAFSYGVNSNVDLFASVAVFASSKYTSTDADAGLGTIRAGVQGSLPFPQKAFFRIGGQAAINGGTAQNQINTYRADGYNYFETRTGWDVTGKLMQTVRFGGEDNGVKLHLNEGAAGGFSNSDPALLLLGAGLQGNVRFAVLGLEIHSRTRFNDMAFGTDPLWVTPSLHLRTPWNTNILAGADISLSADRADGNPRALEPYRVFGAVAFSIDLLESRRRAAFARKQREAREKTDLQADADRSAYQVQTLSLQAAADSLARAHENESNRLRMDAMEKDARLLAEKANADSLAYAEDREENRVRMESMFGDARLLAKKAQADSLAFDKTRSDLAREKEKRSEAENKLLTTGEMLLDAVYFETGNSIITINSKSYLNIIAKMLLKYPKLRYEVAGYTDNTGDASFNVALSRNRANAVRLYLQEVGPSLQLTAVGYGMSNPRADNTTSHGRQMNRRVELRVTNKTMLREYSQLR